VGLRCILHDFQVVFSHDVADRIHVRRVSIDVYRHDGGGSGCYVPPDIFNVQAVGPGIAIRKHRREIVAQDRLQTTDNGEGWQNNLGFLGKVEDGKGQFQGHGPVADSNAVPAAAICRPFVFEALDVLSRR